MQSLQPSDLLTLCDGQGGCSSLTTVPRSKIYDMAHTRINDISYVSIYSISQNNDVDRPPDYDDVLVGELSGQEVLPKAEHHVPNPMFRGDNAERY